MTDWENHALRAVVKFMGQHAGRWPTADDLWREGLEPGESGLALEFARSLTREQIDGAGRELFGDNWEWCSRSVRPDTAGRESQ